MTHRQTIAVFHVLTSVLFGMGVGLGVLGHHWLAFWIFGAFAISVSFLWRAYEERGK